MPQTKSDKVSQLHVIVRKLYYLLFRIWRLWYVVGPPAVHIVASQSHRLLDIGPTSGPTPPTEQSALSSPKKGYN